MDRGALVSFERVGRILLKGLTLYSRHIVIPWFDVGQKKGKGLHTV